MTFEHILQSTKIVGRPLNGTALSARHIKKHDLVPYKKIFEVPEIFVSKPYSLGKEKEVAHLAYIKDSEETYILRSFFFSRSQGVARALKAYKFKIEDGREKPTWNDKGYGEECVNLPIDIQCELAALKNSEKVLEIPSPELFFYGTAPELQADDTFEKEVQEEPLLLAGNFYGGGSGLTPPENMLFTDKKQEPNFSRVVKNWVMDTAIFGKTTYAAYLSHDGSFTYLFMTSDDGRSWIGCIDNDSPVTSFGVRKRWVSGGDLTTPAFEYLTDTVDQTGGYGNTDISLPPYVDMYKNYLSKIPLIQEFERSKT